MRVVILTEAFAKNMGYAGSMLPKYLARLGAEVHVVTPGLPPYHNLADFGKTYGEFLDPSAPRPGSVEEFQGYTLHVVGHRRSLGYVKMVGLRQKLKALQPDVVQTFAAIGHIPLDAALCKVGLDYKLFTGNHTTASVFPLARRASSALEPERLRNAVLRELPGRIISLFTEKCYGATKDCAEVAVRFFGVPHSKIDCCPLGVDTETFWPARGGEDAAEREKLRRTLGISPQEIVCVYTGRFSADKNPLLLAQAVAALKERGVPVRGLFYGNGEQAEAIKGVDGCLVHPFVPSHELGGVYRSADIGVWPTQESTSMLDAAACGLPIVVNDTLAATERVEGNGLRYRLNDLASLVETLERLMDPALRRTLGEFGARKMASDFSWEAIAAKRLSDYRAALG